MNKDITLMKNILLFIFNSNNPIKIKNITLIYLHVTLKVAFKALSCGSDMVASAKDLHVYTAP